MVTVVDRAKRVEESKAKIMPPFALDETLCLYSPQDNLDSLAHPRVAAWIDFVTTRYEPILPPARKVVLVFMPCTKTKPYVFSTEHKRINQALINAGFRPHGNVVAPREIAEKLEPHFSPDVLNLGPLVHKDGTIVHRAVISEPLGFVPYEHLLDYPGGPSPATAYDDPGLFENRGNAVSPWRPDSTATQVAPTQWKWGANELAAYVAMHNAMAKVLAEAIERLSPFYAKKIAWVAPGLTHRSFVAAKDERKAHGIPMSRKAGDARLPLVGANDILPRDKRILALPTAAQCDMAIDELAARLGRPRSKVGGDYSRGGGDATPLALPELLKHLIAAIRA